MSRMTIRDSTDNESNHSSSDCWTEDDYDSTSTRQCT